jgi:PAS domain S-box-containing protein
VRDALEQVAAGNAAVDAAREQAAATDRAVRDALEQAATAAAEVEAARGQAAAADLAARAAREAAGRAGDDAALALENVAAVAELSAAAREQAEAAVDTAAGAAAEVREALDARTAAVGDDIDGVAPRLDSLTADVTRAVERAEAAGEGGNVMREELAAARADLSELRKESARVLEEVAMSRQQAQAAMQRAQAGDQRIERLSSELTSALATLDEFKAGLTIARRDAESATKAPFAESETNNERVSEVFREIIDLAARTGGTGDAVTRRAVLGELRPKGEVAPPREPRRGFDDVTQPMAVLTLQGRFTELNPSFAKLVGYKETQFAKAVWPSVHDRAVYQEQTAQLKQMSSGELESVPFQSSYMHAQGLMVAVDGVLTLVRDDDGEPVSVLLSVNER